MAINKKIHQGFTAKAAAAGSQGSAVYLLKKRLAGESAPGQMVSCEFNMLEELLYQVQSLTDQLMAEKRRNQQLMGLNQFHRELDYPVEAPLAAQQMSKTLQRLLKCSLVCVLAVQPAEQRFRVLSSIGPDAHLAPNSMQIDPHEGLLGAVLSEQRSMTSADLPDERPVKIGETTYAAALATPLIQQGEPRGMILAVDQHPDAFSAADIPLLETAALQLVNVWGYSHYNDTLTEFIQSISLISAIQDTESLMNIIASIARRTLKASFSLVATFNNQEWVLRSAGRAPKVIESLRNGAASFLEEAIKSPYTFRLRDLRRDERSAYIKLDSPELCTLLASPIRVNGAAVGLLMAFGKVDGVSFTETDAFLAELLASQAAVTLESSHLNQELRVSLKTTQLLYDLSLHIGQAEDLSMAAYVIAKTAFHLFQAHNCGLILFSQDGAQEAEVRFPPNDARCDHPYELIRQAMESRQIIYLAETETRSKIAIPIQTMRRCYGALWLELPENSEHDHPTEEIRILINQASVALERSILLAETRQQANELVRAYHHLERSYDQFLEALMKALDARDQETEGHSERVRQLAAALGQDMGLTKNELKALERGALLHDIGKIGISDLILKKTGPLDAAEWQAMRKHPQIGARIVQEIPALQDALPVIAYHQERWDGSGYPLGLSGQNIPILARIFAVVDVYDALTSNRPYRKSQSSQESLEYLESQAGTLFDPNVVAHLVKLIRNTGLGSL